MMSDINARIRDLVAHAYANAPTFKGIMDSAGLTPNDIQSAADLAKLPVTPKDRLVEFQQQNPPFGGLLTIDPAALPRIYLSPGPIFDPQPPPADPAAALAPFQAAGFSAGDRVLNTFMYHLTPAGLLLDEAVRALGCTVIPSGPGNTELQVMFMNALRVTGYIGTPSFLAIILDKAHEMGIPKEAIPIRKALFSAEPYTPAQRARFEGEYGMATVSAYGTADLGFLAYTTPGSDGFVVMNSVYVELVDKDTGELVAEGTPGEVVVTTFNPAYPLIRFGTGDLGVYMPDASHGRVLRLVGRVGDAIKVRGMFLHPNQLLAAMGRIPQVRHARAIITRSNERDVVTVQVELKPEHAGDDVTAAVKQYVEAFCRLTVNEVDVVEPGVIDPASRSIRDERNLY